MAQIREIRKRIKSITSTQKVTHAMELVAAAKMRKAQMLAISARPYTVSLNEIIEAIKSKAESISHRLLTSNEAKYHIIILITSDRGLAGGLNINLFREILRQTEIHPRGGVEASPRSHPGGVAKVSFITVGKKAKVFAAKTKSEIIASFETEEKSPLDLARTLTKLATDSYKNGQAGKISILYPHFESTVKQVPTWVQILPIELIGLSGDQEIRLSGNLKPDNPMTRQPDNLLFEPNVDAILTNILPHFVLTRIYQILLEAKASEHSARMVAMKNATDAAGELVDDLTLTYNQARQEAITTELLDIVTAQRGLE